MTRDDDADAYTATPPKADARPPSDALQKSDELFIAAKIDISRLLPALRLDIVYVEISLPKSTSHVLVAMKMTRPSISAISEYGWAADAFGTGDI